MKKLIVILLSFVVMSCSTVSKVSTDKILDHEKIKKEEFAKIDNELIPNTQLATPDSTKTIIVYNVIEKNDKRLKISDETIRMLIADLFGTITTIITIRQIENNNP